MANIPALPTGRALWEAPTSMTPQPYGAHCTSVYGGDNGVDLLDFTTGACIATWSPKHGPSVTLAEVRATTVPYVNSFLKDEIKVEKYWRTGEYRIVGAPVSAPAAPVAKVAAPVIVEPEEIEIVEIVEVATLTGAASSIPGVEHPGKVKVKAAGKGWLTLGDIVVPVDDAQTLKDAWTLRQSGVPASVLITGPAGTAKTALVRAFAASQGVPFLKVDGGAIRTADDWAGAVKQDPSTKTWSFHWSPFAQALRAGEPMVILIDDFTRAESVQAANALIGLLDWTGSLLVPDANDVLRLPAGILVVATANIGPEFVGTLPIDGAIRQRFPYGIRTAYPPEAIEANLVASMTGVDAAIATRLVKMATMQRLNREDPQQYPSGGVVSTRVILDIARRISTCGTNPRAAVVATLRGQFDPGDETALTVVIDTQFPVVIEKDEVDGDAVEIDANGAKTKTVEPLITTGKHYFKAPFSGATKCEYYLISTGKSCGLDRLHPVHH